MAEVNKTSVFETLNSIDMTDKIKQKNNLSYLSWSSAWAEVKKHYPNAAFEIIPQLIDEVKMQYRPWHDDKRTGWVTVSVTINEIEITETLAIMDFKNKSIPADQISSTEANKAIKRCLVKAIAMHGLGLYIYEGEDLPEEVSKITNLQKEIITIVKKKCLLSDAAKSKVEELCKTAEKTTYPNADTSVITGNPKNIEDLEVLDKLKKQLLAVRK